MVPKDMHSGPERVKNRNKLISFDPVVKFSVFKVANTLNWIRNSNFGSILRKNYLRARFFENNQI